MLNYEEVKKRIEDHFLNLTLEEFNKNLNKAGYDTYKDLSCHYVKEILKKEILTEVKKLDFRHVCLDKEFDIVVEKISVCEGDGYIAYVPKLGRHFMLGDGDTEEEALLDLLKFIKNLQER